MEKVKIHLWLAGLNSHEIYNAEGCAADFREKTGLEPCWCTITVAQAQAAIEARGVGGHCEGDADVRVVAGYVIAEALAEKHASFSSAKMGRGRRFRECLEALERAGV